MNEKKLNDEEIVKALGYCTKSRCDDETTGNCPLKNDESCGTILAINALDLIRRLQEENECLNAKDRLNQIDIDELHKEREKRVEEVYADFMQDYKIMREELNACQNELAEYERKLADGELDIASYARSWEEGDNRTVTCDLLNAMEQAVAVFNKQKAEIERLTAEREDIRLFQLSLQNGEIDMTIESPMAKSFYDCIVQIFEQNGAKNFFTTTLELESQSGKYAFTIEKAGGITAAERLVELQKQVDECEERVSAAYELGYKESKMRIVKDTAKEILTELIEKAHSNGCIDLTVNEVKAWFREDYGVEVE